MKALVLLFILASFTARSQESSSKEQFQKLKELHSLSERKMKEKLRRQLKGMVRQEKKIKWQEIANSEAFYFYLKEGTPIVDLQTEKRFRLPKNIYAHGLRRPDYENYIYMVSEDGLIYYKVKAIHTVSIDPELNMFTPPEKYVEYTPEQKVSREPLGHELVFSLHYDSYRAIFTSDLFDVPSLSNGSGARFSTDYYFGFDSPLDVGLVGEFENASFQSASGNEKVSKSALSFGAAVRTRALISLPFEPRFWGKVTYALNSQMSFQSSSRELEKEFNQTAAEIGVETEYKLALGTLKLGLSFRRQWLKNIGNNRNIRLSGRAAYDDSYGFFLAWGASWLD